MAALVAIGSTKGWRIQYRWTPSDRRRDCFVAPGGIRWEAVPREKATHVRRHRWGLRSTYLRRLA